MEGKLRAELTQPHTSWCGCSHPGTCETCLASRSRAGPGAGCSASPGRVTAGGVCPLQVHGRGHAHALQHPLQLQAQGHRHDRRGLGALLCHLLPAPLRPQQHR